MRSFIKFKISMDSHSNKQSSQDVRTLIQVLAFMLALMIHIKHLQLSLITSSKIIMVMAKMPSMLVIWIIKNFIVHLLMNLMLR